MGHKEQSQCYYFNQGERGSPSLSNGVWNICFCSFHRAPSAGKYGPELGENSQYHYFPIDWQVDPLEGQELWTTNIKHIRTADQASLEWPQTVWPGDRGSSEGKVLSTQRGNKDERYLWTLKIKPLKSKLEVHGVTSNAKNNGHQELSS